ncbi:rho GTPase-activating protein 7 isoform X1 [Amborella trichopoda]|uniref:rho GTPase-activating protein 7 isoform X1 n=1 Tax=Amborella trichopoda TaxID=13333 RepID=UPI0009C08572|nr:rho GTPase-activating protein 7 isoform X1 [Amborella trichopoda]|eukprot:XP_020529438.1 rho GTPase-activating protein 7 isoform X1 [Amborella trichopoda]
MSASLAPFDRPRNGVANTVFKSGPLFISSKGLGWKSWKKRWFILTRTSLVFFKNDPQSALPQRGGEVNLTLGGIDLNNSGSVVVREDKKLLTVLFPDGRDGRAFTLKAESSEDLFEWKTALEHALAHAPSPALAMGHDGIFRTDGSDEIEGSYEQWRDNRLVKSLVVGRPILLALEDIDGAPSFLEKALCFLEKFGSKVEGILRQSADVEEVDRRVQQYEQGKTEFTADEDAHVVGDCVKHVLRELPSSPVPASCCTALLEAYKIEGKDARINAMRAALSDSFPEPNRRLLQRVLKMMHTVASHTSENRMTASAVAACMAPLLLRPLLAGECELEEEFTMTGDSSAQLLAAANAANNAQAIITTLLEEYDSIFDDEECRKGSPSSNFHMQESGSEESTDDEDLGMRVHGYHDAQDVVDPDNQDNLERVLASRLSESSGNAATDLYSCKVFEGADTDVDSPKEVLMSASNQKPLLESLNRHGVAKQSNGNAQFDKYASTALSVCDSDESTGDTLATVNSRLGDLGSELCAEKNVSKVNGSTPNTKRPFWGRSGARKNLSIESVDSSGEEELLIQRLEITKNELRNRIAKEAKGNAILQASLERRKQALHERRLALEQDVSRLQEQLQAERDLRAALEVGLSMSSGQFCGSRSMDSKTRAELEEIALAEADVARLKQKVAELHSQLNRQRQHHLGSLSDACDRYQRGHNLQPEQRVLHRDFDSTLAFCNNERNLRNEENSLGSDWRNVKPQVSSVRSSRQLSWKPHPELSPMDSKSTEASTSVSADDLCAVDSTMQSTSREMEADTGFHRQPMASSALVELTSRLDFFKERRTQLMEQLHNLDLGYGPSSQGFEYKSSPPWTSP